jgi:hypothetical protein
MGDGGGSGGAGSQGWNVERNEFGDGSRIGEGGRGKVSNRIGTDGGGSSNGVGDGVGNEVGNDVGNGVGNGIGNGSGRRGDVGGGSQGRSDTVGAFQWGVGEHGWVIPGRLLSPAVGIHGSGAAQVAGEQRPVPSSECIHVRHHAGRTMDDVKAVAEQLLGPAANLVDGAIVFQNLLDTAAVTQPIKGGAP